MGKKQDTIRRVRINYVPFRKSAISLAAAGRPGARRALLAGGPQPPQTARTLRPPRHSGGADARSIDRAHGFPVHPFLRRRRAGHTGCGAPAVRFEAPRGESPGHRNDAHGRRFELDAGRRFRTQPSRTDQIRHRQTLRGVAAGPRGTGRLRGRTQGPAADHLGLPHGPGLRTADRPVAGIGAGHGHRQGAGTGPAGLLGRHGAEPRPRHHPHHRRREPRRRRHRRRRTRRTDGA